MLLLKSVQIHGLPKKREDEKSAWYNIKPFGNVSGRAGMKVAGVKEKTTATNGKNVTGLRNMENVICTIWAIHCEQSDYIVNVLFMMFLCWLVATNAGQTHLFSALQSCWRRLISTGHRTLASKNEQFKCNNFHRVYRNYYRHLHSINLHFLSSLFAATSLSLYLPFQCGHLLEKSNCTSLLYCITYTAPYRSFCHVALRHI